MLKKLLFFPELVEFFLSVDPKEFERGVRRSLKHHFEFRDRLLVVPPERLSTLEQVLQELKKLWLKGISLPLPVSLVPRDARGENHFRPGRIYLDQKEAKGLSGRLSSFPFLVQLRPWRQWVELVLPSTETGNNLLFHFRDLLLVGTHAPCPFCGLRWHPARQCPTLKERDPFLVIQELLRQRPQALAEKLNGLLAEGKDVSLFCGRYPYFKPAFLRHLFTTTATSWDGLSVKPGLEKGGNLFLGLEALRSGDLAQAKERFEAAQGPKDPRPHLGLAFLAMLSGDVNEALYQVENARSRAETPLLQAYLLFLKAWIFERERKYFEAEEHYKEALKRDRSFWPAKLHLTTMEVKFAREHVLPRIRQLVNEPMALPAFFLEGRFLPLAEEVEKILLETFEERQAQALSRLASAEDALRPMLRALPEEEVQRFEEALAEIRRKVYEGGFIDLLLAEKRAFDLSLELQGYLFRQTKKIRESLREYAAEAAKLKEFWRRFPYKDENNRFGQQLAALEEDIEKLNEILKVNPRQLRTAYNKLRSIADRVSSLQAMEKELRREWQFRKQLSVFIKTFLILELVLFGIFLFLPVVLKAFHLSSQMVGNLPVFFTLSVAFLVVSLWRALLQKT